MTDLAVNYEQVYYYYSAPDPPALGVDGTSTMWGSWALFIIL